MNNVTITLSDEEMTKIKVIDIDELYNFVVDDFFSWNYLVFEKLFEVVIFTNSNSINSNKWYIEKWPK